MENKNSTNPSQQPLVSQSSPHFSREFIIILVILIIVVVGLGGYVLGAKQNQIVQNQAQPLAPITQPSPTPLPSKASATEGVDETANWKTYDNEKYGFNIKYPNNSKVTTRGAGEAISAVGDESTFTIKDEMVEGRNISFDIASLGSEGLGSYYRSAKNLDDYTNLIAKKDEKGNIIRKFVKESTVDNRRALWFEIYQWEVDKQAFVWTPEIYFQDKNNIYQVRPSGTISLEVLNQILSTFRFINEGVVGGTRKVTLFYYNKNYDPKADCLSDAVLPVEREIPETKTPIEDTIKLLIEGKRTEKEKAEGFTTEFPYPEFKLLGVNLKDGVLTLDFPEVPSFTTGGSCRVGLLRAEVEKTAKQFSEVKEVRYTKENMFQP